MLPVGHNKSGEEENKMWEAPRTQRDKTEAPPQSCVCKLRLFNDVRLHGTQDTQ